MQFVFIIMGGGLLTLFVISINLKFLLAGCERIHNQFVLANLYFPFRWIMLLVSNVYIVLCLIRK